MTLSAQPGRSITAIRPETSLARTAPVQEVFSSIQGEGIYVGMRQVFVRFAHCHLKCAYCDTPMTSVDGRCHVETRPGSGEMDACDNPLSVETLAGLILDLLRTARHHSVSLTGGEPLLYHGFLRQLLPLIRAAAPTYLETSGTQPEFFEAVSDWVDIVAMDIKLPSATGEAPRFGEHAAFYRQAREKDCFIKLVFNERTTVDELEAIRAIVTDRNRPIILQPETLPPGSGMVGKTVPLPPRRLFDIENALSVWFEDVRVIPQTHKMLQVL
jgi:organic radical activating enzyme